MWYWDWENHYTRRKNHKNRDNLVCLYNNNNDIMLLSNKKGTYIMSEQEIYEITRNYAVVTAVLLILSVIGIYLLLKRKDDHLLGIVTSVFQIAISFAMLSMNFTITLLHDGMGADDTMLVKFCLYGWILELVLMAVSAIITIRYILKQRKKQTKLNY